jgi:hypothetical protein
MHPPVVDHTLVAYMTRFAALRGAHQADDAPHPELQAARFCLTGITPDDSLLAGIDTASDSFAGSQRNPYIRRDLDSVLGYSPDIPVLGPINYFPYPNPTRTLHRSVHVRHYALVNNVVSETNIISNIETDNSSHITHCLLSDFGVATCRHLALSR